MGNYTYYIWKCQDEDTALLFEPVASFRFPEAEGKLGWVTGVAVSRSGDWGVAGDGGLSFWSSGEDGTDGGIDMYRASNESGAKLRHVLLSEDEASVSVIFSKPAGCEVWDVGSRRRLSPRVALPGFRSLTCAALVSEEKAGDERGGARGELVAGGWDQSLRHFISRLSPTNDFKVSSTYRLASLPRSVSCTSFGGGKRILVGSDDGCVRMLGADVFVAKSGAERYEGGALSLESGCSEELDEPELSEVRTVAVMPAAGRVVAGHEGGQFSLWCAENGEFVRSFQDERGDWVLCIDFSADERLVVSGHGNGIALVWNASTWEPRFALEGHSEPVVCVAISVDAKRIVAVDWDGELLVWDAESESGGVALLRVGTGLEFVDFGFRGWISLDGGLFLWANKDEADEKWRGKVIDLGRGNVTEKSEAARHSDWDFFLEEMMSNSALGGGDVRWRSGALFRNRSVELQDADSRQQSAGEWRVVCGNEYGEALSRVYCALRSAEERTILAVASLNFDCNVNSIAGGWIPGEAGDRRRAVVACWLSERSLPAILHFCRASD